MSKWTIYDRNGKVLHESVTKYDGDGNVVQQDTLEMSGKWMGESYITVSFKAAYPIDFQIGDYIIYRGEKYVMNYDPTVVKKSSRGSYGESFVYDSVKFNALTYELTDMKFHDWVLSDNKIHYSSLPNFSFYAADMNDLADRLQACADRWCKDNGYKAEDYWVFYTPGKSGDVNPYDRTLARAKDISTDETFLNNILSKWKKIYGDDGSKTERDDERLDRTISISNQTVWQGLALFKSQFGLNFLTRGRDVYVGSAGIVASHIFKYGKGNGLYEVHRQADTNQKVVTRLHAYGSSDNLPTRYYAEMDMEVFGTAVAVNKGTDRFQVGLDITYKAAMYNRPLTGSDGMYLISIKLGDNEIKARVQGMLDNGNTLVYAKCISGDTDADNNTDAKTFNAFLSALSKGSKVYITEGVNKDLAPTGFLDYSANQLPNNMAINNLMLPGFPKYALSEICKSEYSSDKDITTYYIRKTPTDEWIVLHTEPGNHVVTFSTDRHDPYIVSPNAATLGYKDDDIFCTEENDDNGLKKVYPSVEELTEADAGISSSTDYVNTIVKADVVKDNGVYPKKTGTGVPGFTVTVKNLGFNLHDAIADAGGESCKLSMKDGFCGGREFDVPSVDHNDDGTWTLHCKRCPDSSLDLYYPYSYDMSIGNEAGKTTNAYQICPGDKYVLLGISIKETNYIWAASRKLLRKAIHWLCKNDYTRYTYNPKIDEIYMARQDVVAQASGGKIESLHDTLKEGGVLWFQDDDLMMDGKVYIDQLSIKENGNNGIPTYDITLRNEVQVGTIERIQNKVDSIANDVRTGNIPSTTTPSQIENIAIALGEQKWLSKEHDDTAEGIIDFLKGIKIGGRPLSELFLSKEHDDTAEGNIGFGKDVKINGQLTGDNIRSSAFNSGMQDGVGFRMMYDGKESWLEIDKLTVRMRAVFQALDVRKAEFSAGNLNLTGAGARIVAVADVDEDGKLYNGYPARFFNIAGTWITDNQLALYVTDKTATSNATIKARRCYFEADDGERRTHNLFHVGDMVMCQTFNLAEGVYQNVKNKYYWRTCVRTGDAVKVGDKVYHYIDLYTDDEEGSVYLEYNGKTYAEPPSDPDNANDLPEAGDEVVQLGNFYETDRQNALSLVAVGSAPKIALYTNICEYYPLSSRCVMILCPTGSYINTNFLYLTTDKSKTFAEVLKEMEDGITNNKNAITDINVTANGVSSRVSSVEEGLESANSKIQQMPDEITASVTESVNGELKRSGLSITPDGIEADAKKFTFVNSEKGTPYIKIGVEADTGLPYLIFCDANGKPAYNLGFTGLSQIAQSAHKRGWGRGMYYTQCYAPGTTVSLYDIAPGLPRPQDAWWRYDPAYIIGSDGKRIYVPSGAEDAKDKVYVSPSEDSEGLPVTEMLADGWYLFYVSSGYISEDYGGTKVRIQRVTYGVFLIQGGKMLKNIGGKDASGKNQGIVIDMGEMVTNGIQATVTDGVASDMETAVAIDNDGSTLTFKEVTV